MIAEASSDAMANSTPRTSPVYSGSMPHGSGCECLRLIEAMHACAEAVPFSYCYRVLQKRYRMTCHHGETGPAEAPSMSPSQWPADGHIDSVTAILIKNA